MESMDMGGYGAFIWPSFAIAAVIMVGLVIQTLAERKRNKKRLDILRANRRDRAGRE